MASIIIALIALAGAVFSTVVTGFWRPALTARDEATRTLERYRSPLLGAAYELQARVYNILCIDFVGRHVAPEDARKREAAIGSTLYVFAQYFGWHEIIRREIQYLRFAREDDTREVARILRDIGETFLADRYGDQFMIWRVEQRGLGECMIDASKDTMTCLGYASFLNHRDAMREWLDPIARDLEMIDEGGRERLTRIQHLLLDLVERLDEGKVRYPFDFVRA